MTSTPQSNFSAPSPGPLRVAIFCKFCTHCRSGIPYDVVYYQCRFCQLYFCQECSGTHPSAHRQKLLRLVSKTIPPGAIRYEKSCHRCSKLVHCRRECQMCGVTFCKDCHRKRDCSHEHDLFTAIEAPFHSLKLSDLASKQDFCTENTVSHCSRCQCPIDLQQEALKCKTCVTTYDDSINLCQPCYAESWGSHDQSHDVLYLTFQAVENDSQTGLSCRDCHERVVFLDRTTLTRHPHNKYTFHLGPLTRESAVNSAYRLCQRKGFRKDQPRVMECARCEHEFPSEAMRICAGKCEGNFCDECFPLASLSHVHGPSNFRSLNDEACPDIGFLPAGWRAMRNTEGRIYYIQDQTNDFTFEKPRLPSLPAGWVAILDTGGETVFVNQKTNRMTYVSPIFGIAPEGWDLRQTKTGRLFYVNRQTGATTWHKPLPIDSTPLPPGWEAAEYSDGRIYYINHFTKTNTWTRPTLPANSPTYPVPSASNPVPNRSLTVPSTRPVSMIAPQSRPSTVQPVQSTTGPMFHPNGSAVGLQGTVVSQGPASLGSGIPRRAVGQKPSNQSNNSTQPLTRPPLSEQPFSYPPVSSAANTSAPNFLTRNPFVIPIGLAAAKAAMSSSATGGGSGAVDSSLMGTGDTNYIDTSTLDFGNNSNINLSSPLPRSSENAGQPQSSVGGTTTSYNSTVPLNAESTGSTIHSPASTPSSQPAVVTNNDSSNKEVRNAISAAYASNPPDNTLIELSS